MGPPSGAAHLVHCLTLREWMERRAVLARHEASGHDQHPLRLAGELCPVPTTRHPPKLLGTVAHAAATQLDRKMRLTPMARFCRLTTCSSLPWCSITLPTRSCSRRRGRQGRRRGTRGRLGAWGEAEHRCPLRAIAGKLHEEAVLQPMQVWENGQQGPRSCQSPWLLPAAAAGVCCSQACPPRWPASSRLAIVALVAASPALDKATAERPLPRSRAPLRRAGS